MRKTVAYLKTLWAAGYVPGQGDFADMFDTVNKSKTLLGIFTGANLNVLTDQVIALDGGATYVITDVLITNASTSLTAAANAQLWDGAAKTGTNISSSVVSAVEKLRLLITAGKFINKDFSGMTMYPAGTGVTNSGTVYFSMGTIQGGAATADIYIFGFIIS